jgi:DNA-directed RNA polymerase subunit RPC12/RpoP
MIVRCSQCGAKINRRDENRFFTCPFCASRLVLEGGRSFACLIMEHSGNDAWVRALFSERLNALGIADSPKTVHVEFFYYPFWFIRMADGTAIARPAAHMPNVELFSIKVPPGRLKFHDETNPPPGIVVPFTVPLEAVFGGEGERLGSVLRIDLVYLPIYSMRYQHGGASYTASVVGDSPRVFPTLPPFGKQTTSKRPLIFFTVTFAIMIFAGFFLDGVLHKAAAVGAAAAVAIMLSPVIIGSRGPES